MRFRSFRAPWSCLFAVGQNSCGLGQRQGDECSGTQPPAGHLLPSWSVSRLSDRLSACPNKERLYLSVWEINSVIRGWTSQAGANLLICIQLLKEFGWTEFSFVKNYKVFPGKEITLDSWAGVDHTVVKATCIEGAAKVKKVGLLVRLCCFWSKWGGCIYLGSLCCESWSSDPVSWTRVTTPSLINVTRSYKLAW